MAFACWITGGCQWSNWSKTADKLKVARYCIDCGREQVRHATSAD